MREPTREEWKSWAAEIERPRMEAEKKAADETLRQAMLASYQAQAMFQGHISMQMPCPYCGRYASNYGGTPLLSALGLGGIFG